MTKVSRYGGHNGARKPTGWLTEFYAASRASLSRCPAIPAGAFALEGCWTISDLIRVSAEVWQDLADVEDDLAIAAGYRSMARDLEKLAGEFDRRSRA